MKAFSGRTRGPSFVTKPFRKVIVSACVASGICLPVVSMAPLPVHAQSSAPSFAFSFTFPAQVQFRDVVIGSHGTLNIESDASIAGGRRSVVVNTGTQLSSVRHRSSLESLYAFGPVNLEGVTANGSVYSEQSLSQSGSTVLGQFAGDVDLGRRGGARLEVAFPANSAGQVHLDPDQQQDLLPGRYDSVSVKSRATLRLVSGKYYFSRLSVAEPQATLWIDDSAGPVEIYVLDELTFRGQIETPSGTPAKLFVGYFGTQASFIETAWSGTVVAPFAELVLATSLGGTHEGAFLGKDVLVRAGTQIRHVPTVVFGQPQVPLPVNPDAITPIPGYTNAPYFCEAGLVLNGLVTDANGDAYYDSITYPLDPDHQVPGSGCHATTQFCDAEGNAVPAYSEAELNASATGLDSCGAVAGPDVEVCAVDPATITNPCSSDDDCSDDQVCSIVCTDALCLETESYCGSHYAGCDGLPPEASGCDPFEYRECPDPRATGSIEDEDALSQLPTESEPQASIFVPEEQRASVQPFVSIEQGYCNAPGPEPAKTAEQNGSKNLTLGNDQFGIYAEPTFGTSTFTKMHELFGEGEFEVGGYAGMAAGVRLLGEKFEGLSVTLDVGASHCGLAAGGTVKLFGDAILALDSNNGLHSGLGPISEKASELPDFETEECLANFDARNKKAGDLRKAMFAARELRAHVIENGVTVDVCSRTNFELGTNFDCLDSDLYKNLDILEAWEQEYENSAADFLDVQHDFDLSKEAVGATAQVNLFDVKRRYTLVAAESTIPLGPVPLLIAFEAFGFWELGGALQAGLRYDGEIPNLLAPPVVPQPGFDGDVRAIAGPIFTPAFGASVAVFAGVGFPAIAVGVEGTLNMLKVSLPFDARASLARTSKDDPRDLAASDFAGEPIEGIPSDTVYEWESGWAYGGRMVLEALNGQLDAVARVKLLFVQKTFRRKLADWDGISLPMVVLAGGEGGDPLTGASDFGTYADRIAHTGIVSLTPDDLPANPDPDAVFPGVLGSEACIIVR